MSPQSSGYRERDESDRMRDPAALDVAEADAIMAGYREWAAAGRPGAVSHEQATAELLRG